MSRPDEVDLLLARARERHPDDEIEAYVKRGRVRRTERRPADEVAALAEESGVALRGGGDGRSWFVAATSAALLPAPVAISGEALLLPADALGPALRPAQSGIGVQPTEPTRPVAPLLGESESSALLARAVAAALAEPRTVLLQATLDDGASAAELLSSRGVRARVAFRSTALRIEIARGSARATVEAIARDPSELRAAALGRRVAESLAIATAGRPVSASAVEAVVSATVAARLVEVLARFLVPAERRRAAAWWSGGASASWTLVDDGGLATGPAAAATDGEGVGTRAVALVDGGRFAQPLVDFRAAAAGEVATGCARRASWRDVPRPAPTQLYLAPRPDLAPAELVADVADGFYWIDLEAAIEIDLARDRIALPVRGFALTGGRATAPVAGVVWHGSIAALLSGLDSAARDLEWVAGDGFFGSPTLRLRGLDVSPRSG